MGDRSAPPENIPSFLPSRHTFWLPLGMTAVFIGYLSVWLPGPAAGLQFIGLEMGEWLKFSGMGTRRNLFYLPPITLTLILLWWTAVWPHRRWQAWALRGLAVLISLLAFPAFEDITGPFSAEYTPRLHYIGFVLLSLLLVIALNRASNQHLAWRTLPWLLIALSGVVGALLPLWIYNHIRPLVGQLVGMPVGVGMGVWLNTAGHILVTIASLHALWRVELKQNYRQRTEAFTP